MSSLIVNVNLDKRCSKCRQKGATQNGLCITCTGDLIVEKIKEQRKQEKAAAKKKAV